MPLTVSDLMSQRPPCLADHATIDDALGALLEERASDVFVTDGAGRLLGRVPEHRLFQWRLSGLPGDERVAALVEEDLPSVTPDDRVESVVVLFQENKFRTVAVCDQSGPVGRIDRCEIPRLMQTERTRGRESADGRRKSSAAHRPAHADKTPLPRPRFIRTRRSTVDRAAFRK